MFKTRRGGGGGGGPRAVWTMFICIEHLRIWKGASYGIRFISRHACSSVQKYIAMQYEQSWLNAIGLLSNHCKFSATARMLTFQFLKYSTWNLFLDGIVNSLLTKSFGLKPNKDRSVTYLTMCFDVPGLHDPACLAWAQMAKIYWWVSLWDIASRMPFLVAIASLIWFPYY